MMLVVFLSDWLSVGSVIWIRKFLFVIIFFKPINWFCKFLYLSVTKKYTMEKEVQRKIAEYESKRNKVTLLIDEKSGNKERLKRRENEKY